MTHHSVQHLAEAGVRVVQPGTLHYSDVELRAVGIGACVGHAHPAWPIVPQDEVLVFEAAAIDTVPSSAVVVSEITSCRGRGSKGEST